MRLRGQAACADLVMPAGETLPGPGVKVPYPNAAHGLGEEAVQLMRNGVDGAGGSATGFTSQCEFVEVLREATGVSDSDTGAFLPRV